VSYNVGNQLSDLIYGLGIFNVEGNVFSPNGANLQLNKSAGALFNQGANYTSLTNSPHVVTTGALTATTFRHVNRSGVAGASTTSVDTNNYDLAGVTTTLPNNKYAVARIFMFVSNLCAIQRPQQYYNSLAEAKAGIQSEVYVANPGLANGILRGYLVFKKGTTALNSTTEAFFLESPKFGGSAGVGGLSVSTLQNAYDNSNDPEILTDSVRGGVSIKRGSAADTDVVFEALNGAGSQVFAIRGDGLLPLQKSTTLSSSAGVVTIDLAVPTAHYTLTLTENVTSWVFNNVPASGWFREIHVDIVQHASSAKTVVTPATTGRTAGGLAWVASTVLSSRECLVLQCSPRAFRYEHS
jgi:hypothetical protein